MGGLSALSPVILIRPLIPCAIKSKPPLSEYGPVLPYPDISHKIIFGLILDITL